MAHGDRGVHRFLQPPGRRALRRARPEGAPPMTTDSPLVRSDVAGMVAGSTGLYEGVAEPAALLEPPGPPTSQWRLIRRRFLRHKLAVASLLVLVLLGALALFAPLVAPYPVNPTLDAT